MFKWFSKNKKPVIQEEEKPDYIIEFEAAVSEIQQMEILFTLNRLNIFNKEPNDWSRRKLIFSNGFLQYYINCSGDSMNRVVVGYLHNGIDKDIEIFSDCDILLDGPWIKKATNDLNFIIACAEDYKVKEAAEKAKKEEIRNRSIENYRKYYENS